MRWPRDHAAAAALVRTHRPALAAAGLAPAGRGDFCWALRTGDGRIVRVARHAGAAAALAREACVLARVADALPVPVPRPAHHAPAPGCAFAVHLAVEGTTLTAARWRRTSAAARERLATDLAAFLLALHALPPDAGVACGVPVLEQRAHAAALRAAVAARLARRLGDAPARALDERLAHWSDADAEAVRPTALLHRDVAPGHVLYDPSLGRLTGILDFGDLALGDPARDLVFVDEDFGAGPFAAVLRHYAPGGEAALARRVRRWRLMDAVDWTLTRAALGRGAEVVEGMAEIRRQLGALEPGA